MTYEQKLAKIQKAKRRIIMLQNKLLKCIYSSALVNDFDNVVLALNRAYCTLNQLRFRYWIFNDGRKEK